MRYKATVVAINISSRCCSAALVVMAAVVGNASLLLKPLVAGTLRMPAGPTAIFRRIRKQSVAA